jgi:hypothetical protein
MYVIGLLLPKTKDEERFSRTNEREEKRTAMKDHVLQVPFHKDGVQKKEKIC